MVLVQHRQGCQGSTSSRCRGPAMCSVQAQDRPAGARTLVHVVIVQGGRVHRAHGLHETALLCVDTRLAY